MSDLGRVLAVIPARGGSKEVHRKNIREVGGRPLIAYTIETAFEAQHLFHRIIVSTDDDEIATIAKEYGAEVPFIRPQNISGDKATMVPVLQHAVNFVESQDKIKIDWVCLLQVTNPFRTVKDIENALQLIENNNCDSIISVVQVFSVHPVLMKKIEKDRLIPFCVEEQEGTRRQDYSPPAFMRNGALYITKRDVLINKHSIWGDEIIPYAMPPARSIGIDSELDLKQVDLMIKKYNGA